MNVIDLAEVDAGMVELVGGKAAGLGELIGLGERVPEGFCLTTSTHRNGAVPEDDLAAAYERLGGGRVAVRSSATAEDLPEASFAGQQDTFLNVAGVEELVGAVRKCWESLHTERAVAYRAINRIDHAAVGMAVVVQRTIDPAVAGVLFTANPVTGCRTEMVVDAAPGLGTAVVDGTVVPDHYVIDGIDGGSVPGPDGGSLDRAQLAELARVGARIQDHFGAPQDVEWAIDRDGTLWVLQARPITTLFPLPPDSGRPHPRAYLEVASNFQGVLQPFTPMGMSVLKLALAGMAGSFTGKRDGDSRLAGLVDIAGRPYVDLTDAARGKESRKWLPKVMATDFGPRVRAVVEQVIADPRFAAVSGPADRSRLPRGSLRLAVSAVTGVARALARPESAREQVFGEVENVRRAAAAPAGVSTAAERLRFVRDDHAPLWPARMIWPTVAGILAAAAPARLLRGIATESEVSTVLGGMPYNLTTEMDLALWRLADSATAHRELLLTTPPEELAAMHHAGTLPDIGLAGFLDAYGHRAAAEIDIGVARWEEDPTPVLAAIANYLRVSDREQAPDRRFERAAAEAEAMLADLNRRARRRRPIRGTLAGFFMCRARDLAGLREAGKFAGLYPLRERRRQLLLVGAELAERGLLDDRDDVMFLTVDEAGAAVHDAADHRDAITERKAAYEREMRRTHVPIALLSDGTDVEASAAPEAHGATLTGMPAAPGTATGPARVIRDPAAARIEPGEILVAPSTDPGWTPLFLTAGALVTETGAPIAHGPTVAREYGIPAVICVRDATQAIETGQVITVDGGAGTVTMGG